MLRSVLAPIPMRGGVVMSDRDRDVWEPGDDGPARRGYVTIRGRKGQEMGAHITLV